MRIVIGLTAALFAGVLGLPVAGAEEAPALAQAKPEPYGTFAYYGRETFEQQAGYHEWDDLLTVRRDGTAQVRSKYKVNFNKTWSVKGCDENVRAAFALLVQNYRVTIDGSTLSFTRDGEIMIERKEPACYDPTTEGFFKDEWSAEWKGGRLSTDDGAEFFKQD